MRQVAARWLMVGMGTRSLGPILGVLALVGCHQELGNGRDDAGFVPTDGGGGRDGDGGGDGDGDGDGDGGGDRDGGGIPGSDGGSIITGDFCVDGWCWQRPTQFGTSLFGVWGSAPDDVWAVGAGGTLAHYDGQKWKLVHSGVSADLLAVWGQNKNQVWAVGTGGTILRYDGAAWTSVLSPTGKTLRAVHGTSATDAYAVGDEDTRLHWDGVLWNELPTLYPNAGIRPNQHGVWAAPSGEVWSAGVRWQEAVPHRTGGAWTTTQVAYVSSSSTVFKTVWGSSDADVWMSGEPGGQGALQRWNGQAWTAVYPPAASGLTGNPLAITGSGPNDVWFFGGWYASGRWNGSAFVAHPELTYEYLTAGWVHAGGEGWTVGYGGRMAHKTALDGAFSFTGGSPSGGYDTLSHLLVLDEDDAWAVGRLSMVHWNGSAWQDVDAASTTYRQEFNDVWGSAPNDVWATAWGSASPNNLQHWNGAVWTTTAHPGPSYLNGVWGSAANDVWVVFAGGAMRYDGQDWKLSASAPAGDTTALGGSGKNDVWCVAFDGKLSHFDGAAWSTKTSGTSEHLWTVRAFAPDDAWIAGENATLRHFDGMSWSAAPAPPITAGSDGRRAITDLAGASSSDLWASTSSGELFHWNGGGWTRSTRLSVFVSSIARAPSGALFVAGSNGAILRRAP